MVDRQQTLGCGAVKTRRFNSAGRKRPVRLRATAPTVRPLRAIEDDAGFARPGVAKPILNCESAGPGIHVDDQHPRRIV